MPASNGPHQAIKPCSSVGTTQPVANPRFSVKDLLTFQLSGNKSQRVPDACRRGSAPAAYVKLLRTRLGNPRDC
jgi:hypothetical protein